ncbi:MAG: anhydro-N-acetylmuramic acid kinase [Candidatus Hydrogenedentes bacterium]|nr:anhydro-N-acetylmuramic acid kinase [Candidatus Hydrogenedentota bacterium]
MNALDAIAAKPERHGIGLMSGTSCDGVDAALVWIRGAGPLLRAGLVHFATLPYPPALRERLLAPDKTPRDITVLNVELGERFAEAALAALDAARAQGITVDFAASHGHTIAHYPPGAGPGASGTFQIGEAAVIAERTGLPVVSDFRQRDMAAGGQGAPLVPYADWLLFRKENESVVTLNIGGIANFTVVAPRLEEVVAFDSGPGNMAIDGAVLLLSDGARAMDVDGAAAAAGRVIEPLLAALLDHPYFEREPPKSTGREEFGPELYLRGPLAAYTGHSFEDFVATVTAAVARSIADAYRRFVAARGAAGEIIVGGGGVRNPTLMGLIARDLPGVAIRTTDDYGIPADAREAMAFAILGSETLCGNPGNVPRATGARRPVVLGSITPA